MIHRASALPRRIQHDNTAAERGREHQRRQATQVNRVARGVADAQPGPQDARRDQSAHMALNGALAQAAHQGHAGDGRPAQAGFVVDMVAKALQHQLGRATRQRAAPETGGQIKAQVGAHAAPPARVRAERIAPWKATDGFVGELAMSGLQVFGLQKPPHPTPIGGGSSNGLAYRETLVKPAEPKLPHPSRQKLEAKMMKPQVLRGNCGFRRSVYTRRQSRPRVMAGT